MRTKRQGGKRAGLEEKGCGMSKRARRKGGATGKWWRTGEGKQRALGGTEGGLRTHVYTAQALDPTHTLAPEPLNLSDPTLGIRAPDYKLRKRGEGKKRGEVEREEARPDLRKKGLV